MNEESTLGGFGTILIIAVVWLGIAVHNQHKQIEQLKDIVSDCDSAVTQANQNIDDLNSNIEDAQSNAWSDYDSMGDALDGLQTGETVSNPCYVPTPN